MLGAKLGLEWRVKSPPPPQMRWRVPITVITDRRSINTLVRAFCGLFRVTGPGLAAEAASPTTDATNTARAATIDAAQKCAHNDPTAARITNHSTGDASKCWMPNGVWISVRRQGRSRRIAQVALAALRARACRMTPDPPAGESEHCEQTTTAAERPPDRSARTQDRKCLESAPRAAPVALELFLGCCSRGGGERVALRTWRQKRMA